MIVRPTGAGWQVVGVAAALAVSSVADAAFQDAARRFEVASIKQNRTSSTIGVGAAFNESPSGITILNATLLRILSWASGFQERDITGGPAWIRSTRFDIVARTDGAPINRADLAEMTMALLRDRYKLLVEPEFVERPVYALVPAHRDGRIGPGLRPPVSKCEKGALIPILTGPERSLPSMGCGIRFVGVGGGAGIIFGARTTMGQFATSLSRQSIFVLGRSVIDATGLAGEYDFRLTVGPDPLGTADSPPSFWFHSALDVQLGLKLEERDRGRVEILDIRDVQLPPEN